MILYGSLNRVYGDTSQLKKAKADPAMQSKGWQINAVDRKKLRSLQAKIFLTQADNVTDNNMSRSSDAHGDAYMESSHGHGHGHASTCSTPVRPLDFHRVSVPLSAHLRMGSPYR